MSWIKWKSDEKPNVKLEGCLDDSKTVNLCKHGNGGYCWFCHTGNEPIDNTNKEDEDPFESSSFKSKLG